jgi:NTE family protein
MSKKNSIPSIQRAIVLQGGGALGAYEAGVFQALYEKLHSTNGNKQSSLFDIVAGTSSGAMNGAMLVSHVVQNGTWQGSVEKLNDFWKYVSTEPDLRYWYPYIPDKKSWVSYWDFQKEASKFSRRGSSQKVLFCKAVSMLRSSTCVFTQFLYAMFAI